MQVHLQSRLRQDSHGDCAICLRPFKAEGQASKWQRQRLCNGSASFTAPGSRTWKADRRRGHNSALPHCRPARLLVCCSLQVLLSCSHTFHQTCLASFERFGRQAQHCCPLCRCQAYEKRRIEDGERLWRHTCAARIQAAWRGCLARRAFRALRRLLPPRHPTLRRRWAAEELGESSARLAACVEQGGSDIDALFAELDATAAAAGAVFAALSSRCPPASGGVASAASGSSVEAFDAGETAGQGSPAAARQAAPVPSHQEQQQQQEVEQTTAVAAPDWEAVLSRCLQRDEQPECPICLVPLAQLCSGGSSSSAQGVVGGCSQQPGSAFGPASSCHRQHQQPSSNNGSGSVPGGGLAVLSCSHAFHGDCLSAFEAFSIASELAAACPCCRSTYARLDLC